MAESRARPSSSDLLMEMARGPAKATATRRFARPSVPFLKGWAVAFFWRWLFIQDVFEIVSKLA